jgi:hypothetical protein
MTDNRGIWRSTRPSLKAAAATAAEPIASRPAAQAEALTVLAPECVLWGGQSPVCVAAVAEAPSNPYLRNLERLTKVADDSRILDSRIEFWSWYTGVSADARRAALANGYTVRFRLTRPGGKRITLHTICPDEIR